MTWDPKYQKALDQMTDGIVMIARSRDNIEIDGLMLVCDLAANVLERLYPDDEGERMAALDVFLTRLGNIMDGRKGGN